VNAIILSVIVLNVFLVSIILLKVVLVNVTVLSVITANVILLRVIQVNAVAPVSSESGLLKVKNIRAPPIELIIFKILTFPK
jgi:hypothetical protein